MNAPSLPGHARHVCHYIVPNTLADRGAHARTRTYTAHFLYRGGRGGAGSRKTCPRPICVRPGQTARRGGARGGGRCIGRRGKWSGKRWSSPAPRPLCAGVCCVLGVACCTPPKACQAHCPDRQASPKAKHNFDHHTPDRGGRTDMKVKWSRPGRLFALREISGALTKKITSTKGCTLLLRGCVRIAEMCRPIGRPPDALEWSKGARAGCFGSGYGWPWHPQTAG